MCPFNVGLLTGQPAHNIVVPGDEWRVKVCCFKQTPQQHPGRAQAVRRGIFTAFPTTTESGVVRTHFAYGVHYHPASST
jgi:hypothetical protein